MKYRGARPQPHRFRLLTGLAVEEFDHLLPAFQAAYQDDVQRRHAPPRQRAAGAGRNSVLATPEDKLFFIPPPMENRLMV